MFLSGLHRLARCFALVGQRHQAHLAEVETLKATHQAEVKEVIILPIISYYYYYSYYFDNQFLKILILNFDFAIAVAKTGPYPRGYGR